MFQWSIGPVVQYLSGPVLQWSSASVVQCFSGPVLQWSSASFSGPVLQWSSASVLQFAFTCPFYVPESSQELTYPPIRVNHSLASLDLNTLIMRSQPRRLSEEAHSSLDESSYEVLGESVFDTSDDEGHTESLASMDGHTPDDVSSISDGDDFDDDYMDDVSQHFPPTPAEAPYDPLDAHLITNPDDSTFTELADKEMSESSHLRLEETSVKGSSDMNACGLIKEFDQTSGLPAVLQPYGCPEVRLTIRMALSERYMSVSGSFRLLYVGDLPKWAEKDISRQIGTALDAPPSSSRFNIVRGQLEPSGPALDVDHCTALEIQGETGKSSRVLLTLDDGTQLTFGPGKATHVRGSAPLPDLVIFSHGTSIPSASTAAAESEKFRLARNAFRRHQIPSLDVALVRPFGQCPEAFTFDTNSLRLCVEGRRYQDSDYGIQETLPIDIYNFIEIEPSQLNRHLACIKEHAASSASTHTTSKRRAWNISNILPSFKNSVSRQDTREWLAQRNLWMTLIALTAMVTVGLKSSVFLPIIPHNTAQINIQSSATSSISSSASMAAIITASTSSLLVSTPDPPRPISTRDLTVVTSVEPISDDLSHKKADKARQTEKRRREKAGGFEVEVTGDHQFRVRQLATRRRKPQFYIHVTRESKDIPIRVDPTSGVVDLENEYPAGPFNVTITTRSKPLLQQSFEVQLGSNKSTFDQLKDTVDRLSKTVKHDLALAQSNLRDLTTVASKGLQAGVTRAEEGAMAAFSQTRYWRRRVRDSTQSVAGHLEEAKKRAAHQLSMGTEVTKDISKSLRQNLQGYTSKASELAHVLQGARMPDLWELSRPVRTHPKLLKARCNALRLQKKVQRRIKEKKGKKRCKKATLKRQ
ncbi:hypothetical protein K504DRAFT_501243 [Pleomassaria siparia CBS 279.74]|uniref:Uncharacterized protein n=1 Tax=Pleomassaria siparia CBS 279.74 TaxID=1314801 RepID=A0A6G1KBD2_9PLEO|nr:hypothetical protein K504DRAFT_501243 [Pleomassaria siparia CBS 279.74]